MSKILYTDLMEYATDIEAQTAWVTDAIAAILDNMEYDTDVKAQTAYVRSDKSSILFEQTVDEDADRIGDSSDNEYRVAQGFTLSSETLIAGASIKFGTRTGSPTGPVTYRIETNSGSNLPSGVLANGYASRAFTPIDNTWNDVIFENSFILAAGIYWLVTQCNDQATDVAWYYKRSVGDEFPGGQDATSTNGVWLARGRDICFKIYNSNLECYSENTIKNQGVCSLKAIAKQTGSLNHMLINTLEEVDQQQITYQIGGIILGDNGYSEYRQAQSFQLSDTKKITSAEIKIAGGAGNPTTNWYFRIETDSAGEPSGTLADKRAAKEIDPPDGGTAKAIFESPFELSGSTTYWLVIQCDDGPLDSYWVLGCDWDGYNVYTRGERSQSMDGGSTWTLQPNKDLWFKINVLKEDLDLSGVDELKLDVRANRTGTNLQVQLTNDISSIRDEFLGPATSAIGIFGDGGSSERAAQQFELSEKISCSSVSLRIMRENSPTDDITCRIETDSAGSPSGTLVDSNATKSLSAAELVASSKWVNFPFLGQFTLEASTIYHIVLQRSGSRDATNAVMWRTDSSGGYANGHLEKRNSGSWNDLVAEDAMFKIYGGTLHTKDIVIGVADTFETTVWDISGIADGDKDDINQIIFKILNADSETTYYIDAFRVSENLQCYSEDTIKQQGSYSLKAIANQTASLNKTLTKTIASNYLDYSVQDVIKFAIRAGRTGSNIKLKFHDTGGNTQEHTVNILAVDTWQTEIWDISGIAAADRDEIDKFIMEIINADLADIIYIDNMYSEVKVEHSHGLIIG